MYACTLSQLYSILSISIDKSEDSLLDFNKELVMTKTKEIPLKSVGTKKSSKSFKEEML